MPRKEDIKKLKTAIFSGSPEEIKPAINLLFDIGGKANYDYLIDLLDQPNDQIRNAVALTFRENKFNDALEPLLRSIQKKEHKGRIGTMAYALEKLDCSKKLTQLFELLFNSNSFEVQNHVLTVLDTQIFEFSKKDLLGIKEKWDMVKETWNESNSINDQNLKRFDIHRGIIQDFVDGYLSYLEKP